MTGKFIILSLIVVITIYSVWKGWKYLHRQDDE
jgi:hypothetical protein